MQMSDVATVVAAFQQRRPANLSCGHYLTTAACSVECWIQADRVFEGHGRWKMLAILHATLRGSKDHHSPWV